jgi:predicted short-subunit dehydrogenase-like oxidoreductase (DUF2520 family)
MMTSVVIAGPGRVGLALAAALEQSGVFREVVVFGRHARPSNHPVLQEPDVRYVFGIEAIPDDAEAVFLAVPDAAVPEITFSIAALGPAPRDCAVFHLSGTLPTDVLEPLHRSGYGVGSFRPLVVLNDPIDGPARLRGAYVAVTAAPDPLRTARRIAEAVGARAFPVPAVRRPLFEAAVALGGGALVPLISHALHLVVQAGVDPDEATPALLSLARSVLVALEEDGVEQTLSGPVLRGDLEATDLHLRALQGDDQRLYAVLSRETLRLASTGESLSGLDEGARAELEELLGRYAGRETTGAGAES